MFLSPNGTAYQAQQTTLFSNGGQQGCCTFEVKMMNERAENIAIDRILNFMHLKARPVYVGEISLAIGHSIERTETFIQRLIEENEVRKMTVEEKLAAHKRPEHQLVLLTSRPHPIGAYIP